MKFVKTLFLSSLLAMPLLSGCANEGTEEDLITYDYSFENKYQKLWESNVIYNETMCFVRHSDSRVYGQLFYKPKKLIKVFDCTLEQEFPVDCFEIQDHKVILKNKYDYDWLIFDEENLYGTGAHLNQFGIGYNDGTVNGEYRKVMFTENTGIVMHQYSFTYVTDETWSYPFNPSSNYQAERIAKFRAKLENKEPVNIVFYGDSIMSGCNSSAKLGIPPGLPDFANGFVNELKRRFGYDNINLINSSVPGMASGWGKNNCKTLVNSHNPDLLIIGFGMNDGSSKVTPGAFNGNIKSIIESATNANPNVEIINVATILANPYSIQNDLQMDYLMSTYDLLTTYSNVQIMDMSSFTNYLYQYKLACDMLANNINHPSDFLVRQYVANLLMMIGE